MKAGKETTLGCVMWIGIGMIPIGVILFVFASFGALARFGLSGAQDVTGIILAPLALGITVVGMLIAVSCLGYGIWQGKREYKPTGQRRVIEDCRILARYVYNDRGEQMHERWQWEDQPDAKFYIKLEFPDRTTEEYRCELPVYESCGEGMRGQATVDGKWLGSFQPFIGTGGAPDRGALSSDPQQSWDPRS